MRGLIVDPYDSGPAELYHFTASHLLPLIQRDGLTRGVIPIIQGKTLLGFIGQAQWLTSNPDFDQSWQRQSSLPYSRNAVRLAIKIPHKFQFHLIRWVALPIVSHAVLDTVGDFESWWIYFGIIPTNWIREIVENPSVIDGHRRAG